MGKQLQELDFAQRRNRELAPVSGSGSPAASCFHKRTPSFSLCMMIFFRATTAPVFFDFPRWTSLVIDVSRDGPPYSDVDGASVPKGSLSELAQELVVAYRRAALEVWLGPLVLKRKGARRRGTVVVHGFACAHLVLRSGGCLVGRVVRGRPVKEDKLSKIHHLRGSSTLQRCGGGEASITTVGKEEPRWLELAAGTRTRSKFVKPRGWA